MECYLPARHENQIRCVSTATSTSIRTMSEICDVKFAFAACSISERVGFVCYNRHLFLSSMFASERNLQFQFRCPRFVTYNSPSRLVASLKGLGLSVTTDVFSCPLCSLLKRTFSFSFRGIVCLCGVRARMNVSGDLYS